MSQVKNEKNFRQLTPWERQIVDRLLAANFQGREQLARQLETVRARTIDDNGSIEFQVGSDQTAAVTQRVPVEGEAKDEDGVAIHLLLHVVDGKVKELEIYKNNSSQLRKLPLPVEFQIFVLPAPPT